MNDESNTARLLWGYLSCITFGALGVHRFILGRPVSGCIYAFTGGILGIGIVYDLIIGIPYMASVRGEY
jgi:TM2 domain-containing membrane protein YozV